MKKISFSWLFLLSLSTIVISCAGVPLAPVENDLQAKKFATHPSKAIIYIYRNEAIGALVNLAILIDGRIIGQTRGYTYFMIEADPGEIEITGQGQNISTITINTEPGKNYFIWQEAKIGFLKPRNLLHIVYPDRGTKGVLECKLIRKISHRKKPTTYPQSFATSTDLKNQKKLSSDATQNAEKQPKDNTPPEISILTPAPSRGIILVSKKTLNIFGIARDQSEIVLIIVGNEEAKFQKMEGGVKFHGIFKLKDYENEIFIKAVDKFGNVGSKKFVINRSDSKEVAKSQMEDQKTQKPDLWILSIGISDYKDTNQNLDYADHDAKQISEFFNKQSGKLFEEVHAKTLINEYATRENILLAMSEFLGQAGYDDVVIMFLAGHGIKHKQTGSYYFLTHNASPENLITHGMKWYDFDESIKVIRNNVSKVLLFFDTCHAGAMKVAMRATSAGEDLAKMLKESEGIFVLSSSKAGEESMESPDFRLEGEMEGHGAFTYAILKGLQGESDYDGDGHISISELFHYVSKFVPKITKGLQHPYQRRSGTDMPIYVINNN